jgi:hypothetical protein
MSTIINEPKLDRAAAAFGLAAAVAVVFNTLLAWVKDSYEPLNAFMKSLSGHHWTTHGIADVVLFLALGMLFMSMGVGAQMSPRRVITTLAVSVVIAGLGLVAWFILV